LSYEKQGNTGKGERAVKYRDIGYRDDFLKGGGL
jgi:hypothetical protein